MSKISLEKFTEILEEEDFSVEEGIDGDILIETYTDGGVDMVKYLSPDAFVKEFKEYRDYFNVDEEIEVHRDDERYKNDFTIRESLEDFEEYQEKLDRICEKLKNI